MLISLAVILIIVGAVYYLYLPAYDTLKLEESNLIRNEATLLNIEQNILPIHQQRQLIDAFKLKVDIMQRTLPPVLYQEDLLRTVSEILKNNSVDAIEYNFGVKTEKSTQSDDQEALDKILSGYEDTVLDNLSKGMVEARFEQAESTNNSSNSENNVSWESVVSTIDVEISFEGEYNNLKSAITDLEDLDNMVIVKSLTISKDSRFKNRIVGSLNLTFPYYYDNEVLEKLVWEYESTFEEKDPFDYIIKGSLADPNSPVSNSSTGSLSSNLTLPDLVDLNSQLGLYDRVAEEERLLNADFELILSAPTSILNKFFLTKSDQRDFSLSSDKENEEMSVTIIETQGQYSFNYSTSLANFPRLGEFVSFVPNYDDALYIKVVSSPRIDNSDVGIGRLNVINKTSKPVKVIVNTDDDSFPRFAIGEREGDVSVIRN